MNTRFVMRSATKHLVARWHAVARMDSSPSFRMTNRWIVPCRGSRNHIPVGPGLGLTNPCILAGFIGSAALNPAGGPNA